MAEAEGSLEEVLGDTSRQTRHWRSAPRGSPSRRSWWPRSGKGGGGKIWKVGFGIGGLGGVYLFSVYDPFVSFPHGGRLYPLPSFLEEVRCPTRLGVYQTRQWDSLAA